MRLLLTLTVTASLSWGVVGLRLNPNHRHHARRLSSPVEKRDATVVTVTAVGPTVTIYELNGHIVSQGDAQEGLSDGEYVVIPGFSSSLTSSSSSSSSSLSSSSFTLSLSSTHSTTSSHAHPSSSSVLHLMSSTTPTPSIVSSPQILASPAPVVQVPTSQAPAPQAPAPQAPAPQAPAPQAPAPQAPALQAPAPQAPVSQAPAPQAPTSPASAPQAPASPAPAPQASASPAPASQAPASQAPAPQALQQGAQVVDPPKQPTGAVTSASPSSQSVTSVPSSLPELAPSLDTPFPDGQVPCSQFPAQYGAVGVDYLGLGGWTGLQMTPDYTPSSLSIHTITTGISGNSCTGPGFCSYACPPGYQKSQWPDAQGSAGQSIGGLFCGPDGMLHLSRPSVPTLCEPGAGGVVVQNDLDQLVSTCRTDYPGTEGMTISLVSMPGSSNPLTNPDSASYYKWNGLPTTAQYYVNPKGFGPSDACLWNSPRSPLGAGNWAPIIIGTGQDDQGATFLSLFPNTPTTTAVLDFNVEIGGDVSIICTYIDGQFSSTPKGCTTALKPGGTAVIRYYQ